MIHSQKAEPRPPRWIELALRIMLKQRDRDAISGDLLEEYREEVFPEKGKLGANLWYFRHVMSFLDGVSFGVALGLLLSAWMVMGTLVFLLDESWTHSTGKVLTALYHPLTFNTPLEYAAMLCALYLLPGIPGFLSRRHSGRLMDAIKAGALASALVFTLTAVAGDIRMNIVLEIIKRRPEWQAALLTFANADTLMAQANYYYAVHVPARLLFGAALGALAGAIGHCIGRIGQGDPRKLQNS
jgi:hypothetical protein